MTERKEHVIVYDNEDDLRDYGQLKITSAWVRGVEEPKVKPMLIPIKEKAKFGQNTMKVMDLEDLISENSNLPEHNKMHDSLGSTNEIFLPRLVETKTIVELVDQKLFKEEQETFYGSKSSFEKYDAMSE